MKKLYSITGELVGSPSARLKLSSGEDAGELILYRVPAFLSHELALQWAKEVAYETFDDIIVEHQNQREIYTTFPGGLVFDVEAHRFGGGNPQYYEGGTQSAVVYNTVISRVKAPTALARLAMQILKQQNQTT